MELEALLKQSAEQDESLIILNDLSDMGYTDVVWQSTPTACAICRPFNGRRWKLIDFINNTKYEAPIFSKTHVNCKDNIIVSGPGKQNVVLNYKGVQ